MSSNPESSSMYTLYVALSLLTAHTVTFGLSIETMICSYSDSELSMLECLSPSTLNSTEPPATQS